MAIEDRYLVTAAHRGFLENALRKIEASKYSLSDVIPMTQDEFEAYTSSIRITMEIPDREEFIPQNHQEILNKFSSICYEFISYIQTYNGKNYNFRYITVMDLTGILRDYVNKIIEHMPFPDEEQED